MGTDFDDDNENSSLMFHSAYDTIPLEEETSSSDSNDLPFINEQRPNLTRNTIPVLRVEQSLHESEMENRFMERSQNILPDLEFDESRESFYWRWITFGVPAFYGVLLATISIIRTFAGYHDFMTKFAFWWSFTFGIGVLGIRLYTNWRKQRDDHFLSWWAERPLNNNNSSYNDNL